MTFNICWPEEPSVGFLDHLHIMGRNPDVELFETRLQGFLVLTEKEDCFLGIMGIKGKPDKPIVIQGGAILPRTLNFYGVGGERPELVEQFAVCDHELPPLNGSAVVIV